jgi:hypothetical protein
MALVAVAWTPVARPQEASPAQQAPAQEAETQTETFSGTVTDLKSDRVTVRRSIAGSTAESKVFLIQSDTRVEGKLRLKARVTVGFVANENGEAVARLIVVRQAPPKQH